MSSSNNNNNNNTGNNNATATTTENNNNNQDEPFMDKMKRMTGNCFQSTGLCCFKAKEQSQISLLESKISNRQKKFGVDYLNLIENRATQSQLKQCLRDALNDIGQLQEEINDHHENIEDKKHQIQSKIKHAPGSTAEAEANAAAAAASESNKTKKSKKKKNNNSDDIADNFVVDTYDDDEGNDNNEEEINTSNNVTPSSTKQGSNRPGGGGGGGGGKKANTSNRNNNNNKPGGKNNGNKKPSGGSGGKSAAKVAASGGKSPSSSKKAGAATNNTTTNDDNDDDDIPEEYQNADPSKWKCREYKFAGSQQFESKGREEKVKGPVSKGLANFKKNPGKYTTMMYQADMNEWPENQQEYILLHRKGTNKWKPQGVSPSGWMICHVYEYERLLPFKDDVLPKQFRDKYTDSMTFQKRKLHTSKNKPIMPGRGMGFGDAPNLKIIGDVDPSDIFQGSVGDCWLLSGISSVAEFDGAIKRLFRKTPNLYQMPMDKGNTPTGNMYTITLWDLKTWKEVDIVIDERLPAHYDGSGNLLASKPSEDGELWAVYLEKALSIHCGGWDKIVGGQCTHAWAMLTGCKHQYTMQKNPSTGKWGCYARYNPMTKEWSKQTNSPHDCDCGTWRVAWPDVGGGGDENLELNDEELFMRLYAWDQVNYIVGAGTSGTSDKQSTGGMVDNHAYSVIESVDNVAGTDIDLIKVRNPWGKGEIEDGEFDDDGPGWDKYPQIKAELNPVVADDGIFWVTKQEFFQFFQTIYLSASNMTEFLED